MAVTARFQADFSSFFSAVQKAEVELKSFETGAGRVEKSLNRMVDQFSGRKVIQDATLMAQAVEKIGGASKLTERELEQLGAKATEAVTKMKALGMEVPQNLQKISDEAKKTGASLTGAFKQSGTSISGMLTALGPLSGVLAGVFSISSVVAFGKGILDNADALTRMADQTGIGVEALQRLQGIAADSGNEVDQLTGAISQMQNRLAEGDSSAVGALDRLGIGLAEFKRLSPDEQFMAIARSVAQIEDPMERTRTAMDLFGRAGAQILPSLRSDVDALAESTRVMSEKSVANWDKLGDAMGRWSRNAKAAIGDALMGGADTRVGPIAALNAIEDGLRLPDLPKSKGSAGMPLAVPGLPSPEVIAKTERELKKAIDRLQDSERASRGAAKAGRELSRAFESMGPSMDQWIEDLNEDAWQGPTVAMLDLGRALRKLENIPFGVRPEDLKAIGSAGHEAAVVFIKEYGPSMEQAGFKTKNVNDHLRNVETVLGGVQTEWAQMAVVATRAIDAVSKNLAEGDWIGAIVAGAAAAGQFLSGLFRDEQHERVNDMRDAFQDTFGTFEDMAKAAKAAGYEIERLLDTKKVQDYEREVRNLNDAIRFQSESMEFLNETVKKYGFSIEELGPAWQRQELDKQAQQLFKEFAALQGAQIDSTALFDKMGESVSKFVQDALKTGTEIPEAMRGMLEQFAKSGDLIDENGNVIEDLERAGLSFTMSMSEGFKSLIDEVKKLTDAISRGLGLAIKNLPPLPSYDASSFSAPEMPAIPMANGGSGRVNKPTLFLAGEAGPEDFAFSGANRSLSGGGDSTVILQIDNQVLGEAVIRHGEAARRRLRLAS